LICLFGQTILTAKCERYVPWQWQHRRHTPGVRVSLDTSGVAVCTVARPRPDVHGAEGGILIREDGPRATLPAGRAHW